MSKKKNVQKKKRLFGSDCSYYYFHTYNIYFDSPKISSFIIIGVIAVFNIFIFELFIFDNGNKTDYERSN